MFRKFRWSRPKQTSEQCRSCFGRLQDFEEQAGEILLTIFYSVRSHIVHISAADSLPLIKEAKASGVPITVETCHHYLTFADEDIPDRATQYKCTPPIRDKHNQVMRPIPKFNCLIFLCFVILDATLGRVVARYDRHDNFGPLSLSTGTKEFGHRQLFDCLGWHIFSPIW